MGKKSTKENKTKYHLAREELGWSREYASEQLGMITPERLERIESEKVTPDPKEILAMAETYGRPSQKGSIERHRSQSCRARSGCCSCRSVQHAYYQLCRCGSHNICGEHDCRHGRRCRQTQ